MRRSLLALPLVLVALGLAACGDGEKVKALPDTVAGTLPKPATTATTATTQTVKGDPAAGKKIFLSAGCSGCHTLKDAGSTGNVGPNLDDAKPDLTRVTERVTNGAGAMPPFKDQLSAKDIADVATYVATATGGSTG